MENPFYTLDRRLNRIESLLESMGEEIRSKEKEEILEVDDVCRLFGVTRTTVYAWRRTGKVKSYQKGRRVYFKRSELLQFRSEEIEGGKF